MQKVTPSESGAARLAELVWRSRNLGWNQRASAASRLMESGANADAWCAYLSSILWKIYRFEGFEKDSVDRIQTIKRVMLPGAVTPTHNPNPRAGQVEAGGSLDHGSSRPA